jgi:ell wall binding domain 2 (CWB2)
VLSPPPSRWPRIALAVLGAVALIAGAYVGFKALEDDGSTSPPAPEAASGEQERAVAAEQLGFPGFATKNTTRIGGGDSAAVAAGAALATFPSQGGLDGPAAVSMVNGEDWAAGIAAASLMAAPIGAPLLVSATDEVPELTSTAAVALGPQGSPETDDAQVFAIGDVATPEGLRATPVEGATPAEIAAAVEELRAKLTGRKPGNVLLASSDDPAFAMPAAAWAARSGDPVLFVQRNSVPSETLELLEEYKDVPVYLLGPEPVVTEQAFKEIKDVAPQVKRVGAEDPVSNAIEFARYSDGEFGWNINDPGHGLVIANTGRPMDAGAAAPLSGSGTWGPLLLTDTSSVVPGPLRGYLLDIKPGYVSDPTRAFYNHAWLAGDAKAMSVGFQAQVDELLEIAPIQEGVGGVPFDSGKPESQPEIKP